jgi:hypothetical protein
MSAATLLNTRTLVITVTLLAGPVTALAGECRASLRPLLLSREPEAVALDQVRQLCQSEADGGDAGALYQLALTWLGPGGQWEPDRAIPMIHAAAERGVPEAQYWLAWQYESGPLLSHDGATALGWYLRSAEANHRLALARLAEAYARGELGLPVEPNRALEYRARQARCAADATPVPGLALAPAGE